MKYVVEMGSGSMIYIQSFMIICRFWHLNTIKVIISTV
jgi:hypothetical protein